METTKDNLTFFTLTLAGVTELTPARADALFEAGCDDATPGSCAGVVTVGLDREVGASATRPARPSRTSSGPATRSPGSRSRRPAPDRPRPGSPSIANGVAR